MHSAHIQVQLYMADISLYEYYMHGYIAMTQDYTHPSSSIVCMHACLKVTVACIIIICVLYSFRFMQKMSTFLIIEHHQN